MQVYGDSVPDQAKCPHYYRCPLFRGVRKAGFHSMLYRALVVHMYVFIIDSANFSDTFIRVGMAD